jgi:hypothetical protein
VSVKELLRDDGFQLALLWSALLTAASFALSRFPRVRLGFAVPAVVAALIALDADYTVPTRLALGLALLAVGGGIGDLVRATALRFVLAVPGAAFVALSLVGVPRWVKVLGFVAIAVGAPLVAASDRRAPRPTPPLMLMTVVGVYFCVPDTEFARILVGAFLAAALLAFDPELRAVGAGSCAAVGLVVWDACREGAARPGAVVGAVACLGVLVLLPIFGRKLRVADPWSLVAWVVAAVHVALVVWCSRVAGLRHSALLATVIVVPGYVLAAFALIVARRVRTRPRAG